MCELPFAAVVVVLLGLYDFIERSVRNIGTITKALTSTHTHTEKPRLSF